MQYERILVAVDGSEQSLAAVDHALALARGAGASVTILEVIEEFGALPGFYEAPPPGADRVQWVAEQRFEIIRPTLKDTPVTWDRRVEAGYPADRICTVALEGKYDLIVVGSHGRSAFERFMLGSVSDRVVHHAPCSVMVVRS